MSLSPIHVAPFGALRFVGSRNHGFSPVFTRGYNMPSRRDYYRLKAVATNTYRKKKFTLAAKGDYGLFSPNNALKQHRPFFGEAEKLRMLVGQSCVWEVFCVVVVLVQRH